VYTELQKVVKSRIKREINFFFNFLGGVSSSPIGMSATDRPIVPASDDR
jgi:hypothetical protein